MTKRPATRIEFADLAKAETERASKILHDAIMAIKREDGDIRFFATALLTGAAQLHAHIEGIAGMQAAFARLLQYELERTEPVGHA